MISNVMFMILEVGTQGLCKLKEIKVKISFIAGIRNREI